MILSSFWRRILGMSDKALIRAALGAGSGDVSGPASATDGNVATFDGATGKLIKDAGTPSTSLLLRPDIVGTVSQSGGVPTGAIVERGSNANGEYVRWADGAQICTMRVAVTDQAIATAYGSLFQGTRVWTFPAAFVSNPTVPAPEFKWGSSASWGTVAGVSLTAATLRGMDILSRAVGTNTDISAVAVGRWF